MKKSDLTLSVLLTLGIALAGCSNDENLPATDERVALQVTSGIQTRAYDNQWETGDRIGIFQLKDGTLDTYKNIPYQTTDGTGTFTPYTQGGGEYIYMPEDGSKRDFIAYYPWSGSMSKDNPIYMIDLSQQDVQKNLDFMMADKVTDRSRTDYTAAFQFNHKLVKIKMTIKAGAGIDLTGLKVSLTRQPLNGQFHLLTDTEVIPSIDAPQTMELNVNSDGTSAEAIVFPSENYNGMQFDFETKTGGSYSWTLANSNANPKKFVAGCEYVYDITINRMSLEVTATINNWEPGNGQGDTGVAD